jgi:hypothetical protein
VVAEAVAVAAVAEVEVAAAEVVAVAAVVVVLHRLRLFRRQLFRQAQFRRLRQSTKHHQRHCRRIILAVRITTLFVSRALVNQCLRSLKTHHVSQHSHVQLAMQLRLEFQPDPVQQ